MKAVPMLVALAAALCCASPPVEWAVPYPLPDREAFGYPAVEGVTHHEIYRASAETGWFSHHAQIVHHKGMFFASWSSHPTGEDGPGQRVLCALSENGAVWKAPFECLPPWTRSRPLPGRGAWSPPSGG